MARSEVREKIVKFFSQLSIFWFTMLQPKTQKDNYNISASYVVYSQIWLNLPMDDHHFFYIFLWMIATLATKNKDS